MAQTKGKDFFSVDHKKSKDYGKPMKKDTLINFKVTQAEREAYAALAESRGVGLSKLIRDCLDRLIRRDARSSQMSDMEK